MTTIANRLVEAGLLQFGHFETATGWRPFTLNLAYLPSYPALLTSVVDAARALVPDVEYLLSMADAVPLGVALGVALHKPLIYSRGTDEPPVADLIGAYDIGHSAVLLASVVEDGAEAARLAARARSVGLDAREVIAILDLGMAQSSDMPVRALVRLPDAVNELAETGQLPAGQAAAVKDWIRRQQS